MTADQEGEWLLAPLAAEREYQRTGSMQSACAHLLHRAGLELIPMRARRAIMHRPYDPLDERPRREVYDHASIPLMFIRAMSDHPAAEWWKYGDAVVSCDRRRLELYGIEFLLPQVTPIVEAETLAGRRGRPSKKEDALRIFVQRLRAGTTFKNKAAEARAIHGAWSKPDPASPDTIAERYIGAYHALCCWDSEGNLLVNSEEVAKRIMDDLPDLMAS